MSRLAEIKRVARSGPFTPDWQSLSQFDVPKWFKQAKFGIFIHWGLYSIPAFNNEWYSRNMYIQSHPEFEHHRQTYGPHQEFGYQDFIPLFTAEKFDPDEWAQLIKASGARYVFPVAEHHDGFQLYDSELSHFNAVEMGPKRDVLGELKKAFDRQGLVFCTSSHRAEHWFFMGHGKAFDSDIKEPLEKGDFYWPAMPEPDNQALQSEPYPSTEFLDDWLERTCEIIDNYQPALLYFDWWIQHEAFKEYLKVLMAYYYNRGHQWGRDVGICYKHDAFMFGTGIVEIERGKFAEVQPFPWQTDTAVAHNSWCYTETLDYKSSLSIIQNLIEVVSKNGNLLLNIGPKGDGSIPAGDRQLLQEIGDWLAVNGEGIYETTVWRQAAEGPTQLVSGQFQEQTAIAYTSQDIRFTLKGAHLYAHVLKCPEDGKIVITALADSSDQNAPNFHGLIESVSILGYESAVQWRKTDKGLEISCPGLARESPVVCKITIM